MNIRCDCRRKLATVTTVGRLPHIESHSAQEHIDSLTLNSADEFVVGEPVEFEDKVGLPAHAALSRYFGRGAVPATEKAILLVCRCRLGSSFDNELKNTLRLVLSGEVVDHFRKGRSTVNVEDLTRLDPAPWLHGQLFGAEVDDFKVLRKFSAERDADRAAEVRTLIGNLPNSEKEIRAAHHASLKGLKNEALARWYPKRLRNEQVID